MKLAYGPMSSSAMPRTMHEMAKVNKSKGINESMKTAIDLQRRERIIFDRVFKRMQEELADCKDESRRLEEQIEATAGSIAWADDSTLFYVKQDAQHRPYQVWRRSLGRGGGGDAGRLCSARARAASQVAGEVQLSLQRVEDELQVQRAD